MNLPRVKPDGTVRIINTGTAEKPVISAAPTAAQLEAATDLTPYIVAGDLNWAELVGNSMASLGVSAERTRLAFLKLAENLDESPRAELLWRLNEQVQGNDPGEPVNWRGVNGL